MGCFSGIDVGSQTSKGVIIRDGGFLAYHLLPSGMNYGKTAQRLREELLNKAGLTAEYLIGTITTGHGTGILPFDKRHVADMLCCARGINHAFPSVRTIIDVQAQSSQVIRINEKGKVINFAVSEVCAGGSGCFLEVIANVLQVALEDIGPLSLKSENPVTFTTGCAVFGESEAISRVSEGIPKEDILAGAHKALASKISALVDRVGLEEPCAISGGGGLNIGLIKSLEEWKIKLLVPSHPNLINALGAALIASEKLEMK
jgi:predicted CoA-substrate-specific enzyme activase